MEVDIADEGTRHSERLRDGGLALKRSKGGEFETLCASSTPSREHSLLETSPTEGGSDSGRCHEACRDSGPLECICRDGRESVNMTDKGGQRRVTTECSHANQSGTTRAKAECMRMANQPTRREGVSVSEAEQKAILAKRRREKTERFRENDRAEITRGGNNNHERRKKQ